MPTVKKRRLTWPAGIALAAVLFLGGACARMGASGAADTAEAPPTASQNTEPAADKFNGARAYSLLQQQCDFGPRHPEAEGHKACLEFLVKELKPLVDKFTTQEFTQHIERGPGAGRTFRMTNVLGLIEGTASTRNVPPALMLCAHWDTRPVADQDRDVANRTKPIIGANDGASGVAVLLEVARVLKANRPKQSVVIALWDGEDLGEFFYGARYFAKNSNTAAWRAWRPRQAILIDMIGDSDLRCNRETNSVEKAPELYQQVMDAAAAVGHSRHFDGPSINISDDHLPLNAAGIPAIDLIDFTYPYWHTVDDTPDKCSADSLQVIGDVLLRFCSDLGRT